MFQKKEQSKISEKEINETNTSSLHDKEFKVTVIKMLTGLEWINSELQQRYRKYKEPIKVEECSSK